MGLTSPQNTLAYQLSRPMCVQRDMSWVDTPTVAAHAKELLRGKTGHNGFQSNQQPAEQEAVKFYLMQHALSEVRQRVQMESPLGDLLPVVEAYHSAVSESAMRMFVYVLLICVRETRHVYANTEFRAKLVKASSEECAVFNEEIHSKGSGGSVEHLFNKPPKVTIGVFCDSLVAAFRGKYSGGYGGKKWRVIAEVLRDFVYGKLSPEMFLDTAFTLAHNGGPIFNKQMGYSGYGPHLCLVLDTQAAGFIPQLIDEGRTFSVVPETRELHALCKKALGEPMTGLVDWYAVERASKGNYSYHSLKKKYAQATGLSESEASAAAHKAVPPDPEVPTYSTGTGHKSGVKIPYAKAKRG